jgi:ABC-type nickel/cobalt efflux system permease component RcnA
VFAHPGGEFAISRYTRLALRSDTLTVLYAVHLGEIPTFQQREEIDSNGNGVFDPAEESAFLDALVPELLAKLDLRVDGQRLALGVDERTVTYPEGNGGLETILVSLALSAPLPEGDIWTLDYVDTNYEDRLGWREVVVEAGDDVVLLESSAPTEDLSQALTEYNAQYFTEMTMSSASLRFAPDGLVDRADSVSVAAAEIETEGSIFGQDRFAELITRSINNPATLALILLAALGWGAAHALTPGHGKTIVAAYLVGSRGTVGHAVFLGLTTTLTHTAGVFAVGLITLFASRYILPEQLFPWLGVASGLLVVSIGWTLMRGRFLSAREAAVVVDDDHAGLDGTELHSHGGGPAHRHLPPSASEGTISLRSLFALGVSGGLIPCPSALVVMLSAIALQRIGFGIILIVTFSIGLAGVLTGIGIIWVKARDLLDRASNRSAIADSLFRGGALSRYLPVVSALFIIIAGLVITVQALTETSLF